MSLSYDEIERLVLEEASYREIAEAVSGLSEAERHGLSKRVQSLHGQLDKAKPNKDASVRLKTFLATREGNWRWRSRDELRKLAIVIFAVCPLSFVKRKGDVWGNDEFVRAIHTVIFARRPDWLGEWVGHELSKEWTALSFEKIYPWVRNGLMERPDLDRYSLMYAGYLARWEYDHGRPSGPPIPLLSDQLLADDQLMDDVWSIFRHDTNAFANRIPGIKIIEPYETWKEALLKLSDAGHIDRQRLLDESLTGAKLDLRPNTLSGMMNFHKAMKPDTKELVARQETYLSLLCSSHSSVQKIALEMLGKIEKAKALNVDAFLAEIPTVFLTETKGNAVTALKIIERIVNSSKVTKPAAIAAASEALRHVNADVQEMAATFLARLSDDLSEDQQAAIAEMRGFLPASLQSVLEPVPGVEAEAAPEAVDLPKDQIAALDRATKARFAFTELETSEPFNYVPISSDILSHRVLHTVELLTPIESLDELIDATLHAIENTDAPEDIELILDAISRLGRGRDADFKAKTAPLLHRLQTGQLGRHSFLGLWGEVQSVLRGVLISWILGRHHSIKKEDYFGFADGFAPMLRHANSISKRAAENRRQIRLCTPTHQNGWIDPLIFVERLKAFEKSQAQRDTMDLSYALIRLAPDNRDKALAQLDGLSPANRQLLQFVFGVSELPASPERKDYGVWISAARARDPVGDLSDLLGAFNITDNIPGAVNMTEYQWTTSVKVSDRIYGGGQHRLPVMELNRVGRRTLVPRKPKGFLERALGLGDSGLSIDWERLPTAALNHGRTAKRPWTQDYSYLPASLCQWLSTFWPLNEEPVYSIAVKHIMARISMDGGSSSDTPDFALMHGLFQKNRPWGEMAHLALVLSFFSKDADVRATGTDAFIEGIDAGQFDCEVASRTLLKLINGGWPVLSRLKDALMPVVNISPLHAFAIADALEGALPKLDLNYRNMAHFLEVLLEALASSGRPASPPVQAKLESLTGRNKLAQTARKILAVEASSSCSKIRAAAIEGRLQFA